MVTRKKGVVLRTSSHCPCSTTSCCCFLTSVRSNDALSVAMEVSVLPSERSVACWGPVQSDSYAGITFCNRCASYNSIHASLNPRTGVLHHHARSQLLQSAIGSVQCVRGGRHIGRGIRKALLLLLKQLLSRRQGALCLVDPCLQRVMLRLYQDTGVCMAWVLWYCVYSTPGHLLKSDLCVGGLLGCGGRLGFQSCCGGLFSLGELLRAFELLQALRSAPLVLQALGDGSGQLLLKRLCAMTFGRHVCMSTCIKRC